MLPARFRRQKRPDGEPDNLLPLPEGTSGPAFERQKRLEPGESVRTKAAVVGAAAEVVRAAVELLKS